MQIRLLALVLTGLCFASCANLIHNKNKDSNTTIFLTKSPIMNSFLSIFEIPSTDISRAIKFYQSILDIKIERMELPEMQIGIFPYENQLISGIIIKAEGYVPSSQGVTIYLNAGDNLQVILDKVEQNGGKIIIEKTLHSDESGYFAIFIDSEGNKIGLHSEN